jgi:surface antigen
MGMKIHALMVVMAGAAVVLTGCEYPSGQPNNTATGALIGGGFGAAAGSMGRGGRSSGPGMMMGGMMGAMTGSMIGSQMDRNQAMRLQAQAPVTYERVAQGRPLTVSDVQALSRAGVSDEVIIAQIQNSRTIFNLSATDILSLHDAGVSDQVVNFMVGTGGVPVQPTAPPAQVVQSKYPPPLPVEQPVGISPAPNYVWEQGEWMWTSDGWVWVGGRWTYPPWPSAVWVQGYWYRGPFGGWHHRAGYWR